MHVRRMLPHIHHPILLQTFGYLVGNKNHRYLALEPVDALVTLGQLFNHLMNLGGFAGLDDFLKARVWWTMTRLSYTEPENSTASCGTTPKFCRSSLAAR